MKRALNVSGHVHRIDSEREEVFMDSRIGLLNCICVLSSEIMLRGLVKYFPRRHKNALPGPAWILLDCFANIISGPSSE